MLYLSCRVFHFIEFLENEINKLHIDKINMETQRRTMRVFQYLV